MMAEGLALAGFAIPATLTLIAPWLAIVKDMGTDLTC